jgi:hypothetical protein
MGHQAFAELVMKGSRDHTVPYGDGIWRGAFPGTSCQATIDIVPPEQDVLLCDIRILLVVDLRLRRRLAPQIVLVFVLVLELWPRPAV